ncbi:MAG: hypothetical protein WC836_24315 [Desulfobacula sp.]|jgi:hypothetical protein
MKKIFSFFTALILLSTMAVSLQARTITFDEFASNPSPQSSETFYYDDPITEEYAAKGVHFRSGPNTPAGLVNIGISVFGGDVFTGTNWPGSDFPVLPPATQYLGMDKPAGANPMTGIVMEFDEFCTHLSFLHRRSGNTNTSVTSVNIIYFDTTKGWTPVFQDNISVYTDPSQWGIVDSDAWLPYSRNNLPAFNMVLFYADKKFAFDNLFFYGEWDANRDDNVDGRDLISFVNALGSTTELADIAALAAKFGSSDFF